MAIEMEMVSKNGQMVPDMKVVGAMIWPMDKASQFILTGRYMKANG